MPFSDSAQKGLSEKGIVSASCAPPPPSYFVDLCYYLKVMFDSSKPNVKLSNH